MWILGITHPGSLNGAVCLVKDGEIIAAIEEERVSRIKRAAGLIPHNSIEFVLKKAGIVKEDIEKIALTDENVQRFVEGNTIRKIIVVPGRLVNIVAN